MFEEVQFYRAGSALVSGALADMQVANWSTHNVAVVDNYMSKAMKHYTDNTSKIKNVECPEPCLYKKCVVLRGGLKPKGVKYPPTGYEYVFLPNGKYELVIMDDLKTITDDVYFKKIAPLLEHYIPTISTRERTKGMLMDEKDRYAIVKFRKVEAKGKT